MICSERIFTSDECRVPSDECLVCAPSLGRAGWVSNILQCGDEACIIGMIPYGDTHVLAVAVDAYFAGAVAHEDVVALEHSDD